MSIKQPSNCPFSVSVHTKCLSMFETFVFCLLGQTFPNFTSYFAEMSESSQNHLNNLESIPLTTVTGTGLQQPEETCSQVICEDSTASCCNDKYHRKLAVCSIICGFSCCGVPALIYSVKVLYFKSCSEYMKASLMRITILRLTAMAGLGCFSQILSDTRQGQVIPVGNQISSCSSSSIQKGFSALQSPVRTGVLKNLP